MVSLWFLIFVFPFLSFFSLNKHKILDTSFFTIERVYRNSVNHLARFSHSVSRVRGEYLDKEQQHKGQNLRMMFT